MSILGNYDFHIHPNFGDARIDSRFKKILLAKLHHAESSIPQTFKCWPDVKAAYRFLSNSKVNTEQILSSQYTHWDTSAYDSAVVLAVHDTTELDFTGKIRLLDL